MLSEELRNAFIHRVENPGNLTSLLELAQQQLDPAVLASYAEAKTGPNAGNLLAKYYDNPALAPGEAYRAWAVAAYASAQSFELSTHLWLSVLLSRIAFVVPEMTFAVMDALSEGYRKGKAARNQPFAWAEWQDKSLKEVCRELKLESPAPANEALLAQTLPIKGRKIPVELQELFWAEVEELPGQGNIIEKISHFVTAYNPDLHTAYVAAMQQHAGLPEAYADGFLRPSLDIQTLRDYPAGTLGHAYYHQIVDHGLEVEILKINDSVPASVRGKLPEYTGLRILQTHDLWHCLTAYTVDGLDEIALQAFQLAQLGSPFSSNLLAMLVTRAALRDPQMLLYLLHAISSGWQHGRTTSPLLPVKWEQHWNDPVEDLRQRYGVEAFGGNLIATV